MSEWPLSTMPIRWLQAQALGPHFKLPPGLSKNLLAYLRNACFFERFGKFDNLNNNKYLI